MLQQLLMCFLRTIKIIYETLQCFLDEYAESVEYGMPVFFFRCDVPVVPVKSIKENKHIPSKRYQDHPHDVM